MIYRMIATIPVIARPVNNGAQRSWGTALIAMLGSTVSDTVFPINAKISAKAE